MYYKMSKCIQSLEKFKEKIEFKIINLSTKISEFSDIYYEIEELKEQLADIEEVLNILQQYE